MYHHHHHYHQYTLSINYHGHNYQMILLAVLSKAWVCGRSIARIEGSNFAGGLDVSLLCVLCVVR
jgi:hypothetical protein